MDQRKAVYVVVAMVVTICERLIVTVLRLCHSPPVKAILKVISLLLLKSRIHALLFVGIRAK